MANPERMYFLSREDAQKILDACPDAESRLIVPFARYGGLRCPSELVAMTWADVDWERGRFLVKSPKTAHHADGGRRWVPLFPELRPYLDEARAVAAEGSTYLVERTRSHDTNLQTAFDRIVYRAGLIPWPKPFQNMRPGRETELANFSATCNGGVDWELCSGGCEALPAGYGIGLPTCDGANSDKRRALKLPTIAKKGQ